LYSADAVAIKIIQKIIKTILTLKNVRIL
jgi:hypothetical protein